MFFFARNSLFFLPDSDFVSHRWNTESSVVYDDFSKIVFSLQFITDCHPPFRVYTAMRLIIAL